MDKFLAKLKIKSPISPIALKVALGVVLLACMVFGVVYSYVQRSAPDLVIGGENPEVPDASPAAQDCDGLMTPQASIVVYVSGHVVSPGVFVLDAGARINDAVEVAGGMTDAADPNAVNLAAVLKDEQHVIIFGLEDNMPPSTMGGSQGGGMTADGRINLNTATAADLITLNGIGQARAEAIIKHRDERGGYSRIEEIMNVSGIGESIFSSIKDRIFVE